MLDSWPTLKPLSRRFRRLRAEGGALPALRRLFARFAPAGAQVATAPARSGGRDSFEASTLFLVFSSNIAGIVCARTIHYQFYSWWAGHRGFGLGRVG